MSETQEVQKETIKEIGILEIMEMIPHRYPFLLVDKVLDVVPGESGIGIKNITMNEPFFQGHFPNNPVMPGVLQIEAMAQTSGVIVLASIPKEERNQCGVLFMTIDGVKFRKPVIPGDRLEFHVQKERAVRNVYKFSGKGYVDGQLVSEATFSAMIMQK